LSGLTGILPTGLSTANLGLVQVTGIASRRVGLVAGATVMMLPAVTANLPSWAEGGLCLLQ